MSIYDHELHVIYSLKLNLEALLFNQHKMKQAFGLFAKSRIEFPSHSLINNSNGNNNSYSNDNMISINDNSNYWWE